MESLRSFDLSYIEMADLLYALEYTLENDEQYDDEKRDRTEKLMQELKSFIPKDSIEIRANKLTNSEHEIYRCIRKGYTTDEIARLTHISPNTVKSHTKKVFQKLNVRSRVELIIESQG